MRSLGNERERKERFQRLFRDYFGSMCAFATRYLEDGEEAKDVAHDVFCYLWEHPAELERVEDERNYLYVVTRNKCLDILRRRSARSRYEQSVSSEAHWAKARSPMVVTDAGMRSVPLSESQAKNACEPMICTSWGRRSRFRRWREWSALSGSCGQLAADRSSDARR